MRTIMNNTPLDPTRHHPLEFSAGAPQPVLDQPAARPIHTTRPSASGDARQTSVPPAKRPRRRRALAVIAILAASFLSLNGGVVLGWAAANDGATKANNRLGHVRAQLARASDLGRACARAADNDKRIYQVWDQIGHNEVQRQGADPGSAVRQRTTARLNRLYAELDTRIQDAKAIAEACLSSNPV
jgi:hypothetical protein